MTKLETPDQSRSVPASIKLYLRNNPSLGLVFMTIHQVCPNCGTKMRFGNDREGTSATCPGCSKPFAITAKPAPDFDVFISYASADKNTANTVLTALESRKIRCWIAPRDVPAGSNWAASIIQGIDSSRIMVLVYSTSSDRSRQVIREVERAVSKGLVLIPLRLQNFAMSEEMEYFLSATHWLDATTDSIQAAVSGLADVVAAVSAAKLESPRPAVASPRRYLRKVVLPIVVCVLVFMFGVILGSFGGVWYATPTDLVRTERIRTILQQQLAATPHLGNDPVFSVAPSRLVLTASYDIHMSSRDLLKRMTSDGNDFPPEWAISSPTTQRTLKSLGEATEVSFTDNPLDEALSYIEELHAIDVWLDKSALQNEGITSDSPVTLELTGVSLNTALHKLLEPLGLAHAVTDSGLVITTVEGAAKHPLTATYDVSTLVRSR
jgi:hypothetical protein